MSVGLKKASGWGGGLAVLLLWALFGYGACDPVQGTCPQPCQQGSTCVEGKCQASPGEIHKDAAPWEVQPDPAQDAQSSDDAPTEPRGDLKDRPPEGSTEPPPEPAKEAPIDEPKEGPPVDRSDPSEGWLELRIQAVRVAHDDGSNQAAITPAQVSQWVAESNRVYKAAKMRFLFDPAADFLDHKSTLLNQISGHTFPNWQQALAEGNKLAARFPQKAIAVFRHGRDVSATGGGFGWTDYDFFVMPGFGKTFVCAHQNITLFAHELGHYLGLRHTFQKIYRTNADAQKDWDASKTPVIFDGDGLSDTHPDAFTQELQCKADTQMTLSGQALPIPRDNIMSYHDSPTKTLTPQQIAIIRQVALLRFKRSLKELIPGATQQLEGEDLTREPGSQGSSAAQTMMAFHGRWSQGAHLYWSGASVGGKLSLSFAMAAPGSYRVYGIFTKAPDFGAHTPSINGKDAALVDLYSKYVHHTAPVDLGVHVLKASNILRFTTPSKNPASGGYGLGLDALLLVPAP